MINWESKTQPPCAGFYWAAAYADDSVSRVYYSGFGWGSSGELDEPLAWSQAQCEKPAHPSPEFSGSSLVFPLSSPSGFRSFREAASPARCSTLKMSAHQ